MRKVERRKGRNERARTQSERTSGKKKGSGREVAKRNWEARCGTRRGMPWLFGRSAWPCRGTGHRPANYGAARLGATDAARCATPWCCRLTYLSATAPPATGSAASVQSGVLPICIPDSPPGQSNDSPVYPFSLYRASLCLLHLRRSHTFLSPRPFSSGRFLSPRLLSLSTTQGLFLSISSNGDQLEI